MATNLELPRERSFPATSRAAARTYVEGVIRAEQRKTVRARRAPQLVAGLAVGVVTLGGAAAAAVYLPSRGPLGPAERSRVSRIGNPAFIDVVGPGRKVLGYTPRSYVVRGTAATRAIPVYGQNLKSVVGHLYTGRGFVPAGAKSVGSSCEPVVLLYGNDSTEIPCARGLVSVPDVVNDAVPAATAILSGDGLPVNVVNVQSYKVALGHVVAQSPPAGTRVSPHTNVTIYNSFDASGSTGK